MKRFSVILARLISALALAVPFVPYPVAAEPVPVAMTTDVQGTVWLVDGGKQTKLGLMAYLPSGASLRLDPGAKASITYFSVSREFSVGGPAQVTVETDRLRPISGSAPAVRNLNQNQVSAGQQFTAKQRERQTVATFEMKAFVPGSLQLRQPVDTHLLGAPEEFSWRPVLGAKTYRFKLADAKGNPLHSAEVATRNLRLPDSVALKPGATYSWSVEAYDASGPMQNASADFSLLDETRAKALSRQRPAATASFSERLLYASQLENAGLKLEALGYWKALASERPGDEMLQELVNR